MSFNINLLSLNNDTSNTCYEQENIALDNDAFNKSH